jgi:molybdopterin molybdotransferase
MMNYQEAIATVLRKVHPLPAVEVSLADALGKVLAEPVTGCWDLPPADNSAMDGFSFRFSGQKTGDELAVSAFLPAGAPCPETVAPGMAVRIMTGAPIPRGCDTVAPLEEVMQDGGRIRLIRDPVPGVHIRCRGEELRRGEPLLVPGTVVHSAEIGLLASGGICRVRVYPFPRVALLSTGDELVELGEEPRPGQVVNSNFHLLAARLREEGCSILPVGVARDTVPDLVSRLSRGLEADILVSSGGVSVGDRDLLQEALAQHDFELGFWRVNIRPGKPVLFGTARGRPVFGLPGNPAASAATFELFVRPALRRLAGFRDVFPPRLRVTLAAGVEGGEKRQRFLWGTLEGRLGRYRFHPSCRQCSGQNRSMQGAHALLPVPADAAGLAAGEEVEVLLMRLPPGTPEPGDGL